MERIFTGKKQMKIPSLSLSLYLHLITIIFNVGIHLEFRLIIDERKKKEYEYTSRTTLIV